MSLPQTGDRIAPGIDTPAGEALQKTVHPERSAEGAKSKGPGSLAARLRELQRQAGVTPETESEAHRAPAPLLPSPTTTETPNQSFPPPTTTQAPKQIPPSPPTTETPKQISPSPATTEAPKQIFPSPTGRRCPTYSRLETASLLAKRLAAAIGGADEGRVPPSAEKNQSGATRKPLHMSGAPQPKQNPFPLSVAPQARSRRAPHAPTTNITTHLHSLLNIRNRTAKRPPLTPPCGHPIAPGLQLVESTIPGAPTSPLIQLPGTDEHVHRSRLVFFDTETTGLAGGVGTKAFMIGAAQWRDDHLHVRQLYLTTLGGEAAMLRTFASWLAEDSIFVSYNGKSYDAPLLKGRYRIHRLQHPFESRRHVDLLHPVRRAYRGVWSDCRLQTIERNLLGIVREDDLPGAEAPAAWLAFLRHLSSVNLIRVVEHNQLDIQALARLIERFFSQCALAKRDALLFQRERENVERKS